MKQPFGEKNKNHNKAENEEKNNFAEKIGRFFSPEPQKEKVLRHEYFNAAGDVYYANVSAGYKVAQHILWLVFYHEKVNPSG